MINLTISANSAEELLEQLTLVSMRLMLGAESNEPDITTQSEPEPEPAPPAATALPEKGNGADVVELPKGGRGRGKKATAEPAVTLDRQAIIKGLTDIYMTAAPGVRDRITSFRDGQGVQRLRELKDEAIPAAAKLLSELAAEDAAAP